MRIRSIVLFAAAGLCLSLGPPAALADVTLGVVSTVPERPHFVAAGATTTFVVSARNTGLLPVTMTLKIQGSPSWQAGLSEVDALFRPAGAAADQLVVTVGALRTVRVLARLTAGGSLAEGAEGSAVVSAWRQSVFKDSLELHARLRNRPKIYYVAIDACGRRYLVLNRRGAPFDGTGERLMPRAWAFAAQSARLTQATSVLPAVTDPNHTAALTGSWAGTSGLYSVNFQYLGVDAEGDPVLAS